MNGLRSNLRYPRRTLRVTRSGTSFYTLELFEKAFRRMLEDVSGLPWWVRSSLPIEARVRLLQLWALLYHAGLDREKMRVVMDSAANFIRAQFCKRFVFDDPMAAQESLDFQDGVDGAALPPARTLLLMFGVENRDAYLIEAAHFRKNAPSVNH